MHVSGVGEIVELSHGSGMMSQETGRPTQHLLTVEQTADAMNVSVRFVRRLVAERRIAVHRLGRHVRLSRDDIDAFVAASRSEGGLERANGRGVAH